MFPREARLAGHDAGARMFAPRYCIPAQAATGMAAGSLACYLYDCLGVKKPLLTIGEGRITRLMVGGQAIVSTVREISLD